MKKLIFILSFVFVAVGLFAQSTTPRNGYATNQNNTGSALNYVYLTATDAAGFDSIVPIPHAWQTTYFVTAGTDSIRFSSPVNTYSYRGDNLRIIVNGTSGKKVTFAGTTNYASAKWVLKPTTGTGNSTGSLVLSSTGKAVINFIFDGAYWVEVSRNVY